MGAGAVISGETAIQLLSTTRAWADSGSDLDVLNYALTLEYLEADFYKQANGSGKITDQAQSDLLKLVQSDEEAHVAAITDTIKKLGGTPVAKPTITYPAGTFDSSDRILKTAKVFEETGVGAYLGAAGGIQSKDILQAAAGIFGVECRHAAAIGYVSNAAPEGGIYMGATETGKAKGDVLAAVMPFLGGLPNTGFAPRRTNAFAVETNVNEGTMTSSPGWVSRRIADNSSASVHDVVRSALGAVVVSSMSFCARFVNGPSPEVC